MANLSFQKKKKKKKKNNSQNNLSLSSHPNTSTTAQRETGNLIVKVRDLPHMSESTDDMIVVFVPRLSQITF